jgi:hypothetical protein
MVVSSTDKMSINGQHMLCMDYFKARHLQNKLEMPGQTFILAISTSKLNF